MHLWEQWKQGPSAWVPAHQVADPDGVPGSWLQCPSAPANAAIWIVSHTWKTVSLSPLPTPACQINKSFKTKTQLTNKRKSLLPLSYAVLLNSVTAGFTAISTCCALQQLEPTKMLQIFQICKCWLPGVWKMLLECILLVTCWIKSGLFIFLY